MTRGLIVDLGAHRGDDTRYYLSCGYDVLAVEANPALAERVSAELADEVVAGHLEVVNTAVADREGEIDFYLSDEDLWASTRPDMADRGFGAARSKITVPSTTLAALLRERPTPYYVKIDVEGQDANCIASLADLGRYPAYLSFEADLTDPDATHRMLDMVSSYGYRRFKLVNQATHGQGFSKHMSGPFGEATRGSWTALDQVRGRYDETILRQAARVEYSATGKVYGVPLGRLHKPLMVTYNTRPVTAARVWWARRRGAEVGGWFDIHAAR